MENKELSTVLLVLGVLSLIVSSMMLLITYFGPTEEHIEEWAAVAICGVAGFIIGTILTVIGGYLCFMENSERTPSNITKGMKKGDVELNQFFLILGIIFIIIYFTIFIRLDGPHIVSYHEETTHSDSSSSSMTIHLLIWVIFIYIGCAALFVGFLIKFLSEVRDPNQQLSFMVFLGFIITSANILIFYIYQTLEWFKGISILTFSILVYIFLILAVAVSIIYLVLLIVGAVRDIRSRKRAINLTGKHKIMILISILLLYSSAIIVFIYINSSTSDEETLRAQPPFNFYAVDHEINNLSDMYIGFEFDNSTFTVTVDITNDSIYIRVIQPVYGPEIYLKVNNETIMWNSYDRTYSYLNYCYISWKIVNLQYGEPMTFSFSGKGRAIASDTRW